MSISCVQTYYSTHFEIPGHYPFPFLLADAVPSGPLSERNSSGPEDCEFAEEETDL